MCGIYGIISKRKSVCARSSLASVQVHRGPDMQGEVDFKVGEWFLRLGHQRLSILDLSERGRQPFSDPESALTYNGEIYNYIELAREEGMDGVLCDTEVLNHILKSKGVENACSRSNGMWGFGFLSVNSKTFYLSRDRFGEKPVHYTFHDGDFYFASEMKTLLALVGGKFALNTKEIYRYLEFSVIGTSNETLFENFFQVGQGKFLEIDLSKNELVSKESSYWAPSDHGLSYDRRELRALVDDAVRIRLRSDVPVGINLSGGIDSSIIAASAASTGRNVTCFSAVSPGSKADESRFIDVLADRYQLDVVKVNSHLNADQALDYLRRATWFNECPLFSFSPLTFFRLMEQASSRDVKVILSGQGADECFCGYKKYSVFLLKHYLRRKDITKSLMHAFLSSLRGPVLNSFSFAELGRYIGKQDKLSVLGEALVSGHDPVELGLTGSIRNRQEKDIYEFSVPQLTHYEDRCSMAFSREVRLPFLDHNVVNYGLNLSPGENIYRGWTKYPLRDSFQDILPREISWRKDKKGFSLPQEEWLRKDLVDSWYGILSDDAIVFQKGILDKSATFQKYSRFLNGDKNIWYRDVFSPLALEIWCDTFSSFIE